MAYWIVTAAAPSNTIAASPPIFLSPASLEPMLAPAPSPQTAPSGTLPVAGIVGAAVAGAAAVALAATVLSSTTTGAVVAGVAKVVISPVVSVLSSAIQRLLPRALLPAAPSSDSHYNQYFHHAPEATTSSLLLAGSISGSSRLNSLKITDATGDDSAQKAAASTSSARQEKCIIPSGLGDLEAGNIRKESSSGKNQANEKATGNGTGISGSQTLAATKQKGNPRRAANIGRVAVNFEVSAHRLRFFLFCNSGGTYGGDHAMSPKSASSPHQDQLVETAQPANAVVPSARQIIYMPQPLLDYSNLANITSSSSTQVPMLPAITTQSSAPSAVVPNVSPPPTTSAPTSTAASSASGAVIVREWGHPSYGI